MLGDAKYLYETGEMQATKQTLLPDRLKFTLHF